MLKRLIMAATLVLAAAGSSSAWAGWGCAYGSSEGPGIFGRRWGFGTEQEARNSAMHGCTSNKFKGCRIIGCSADVDSKEDADKLWALTPGEKYTPCGGKGQKKC